jgi:site-specific DNA-methyltransferase (adenine-specific)
MTTPSPEYGEHLSRAEAGAVIRYQRNIAQRGDALELLGSLPHDCAPLAIFDPQHRSTLDRLAYGNEGARQRERVALPQMSDEYIDECCFALSCVLRPSGYLMLWTDAFRILEGHHRRIRALLKPVGLIAWDNQRMGMGYRVRNRGDYLIVLQAPPILAKATWSDHGIPDRWIEKVDRKLHPHAKPRGLIDRLIGATTVPGDLVVDPCAGSFTVMHAALALGREFIGCDLLADTESVSATWRVIEEGVRAPPI